MPLVTERVTRCFGGAAAHTYYAEGVRAGRQRRRRRSAEWQRLSRGYVACWPL